MHTEFLTALHAFAAEEGRVWLTHPDGRTLTYADLRRRSGQLANVLRAAGVKPGDRVLVQAEKSDEVLAVYLACLRCGAVFLPLNPSYTAAETRYFFEDARPALGILEPGRRDELAADGPALLTTLADIGRDADGASPDHDDIARRDDDLAAILYTSGTTGRSKGVMLSLDNLQSNAAALVEQWRFTGDDVLLHALPIFHTHGLFVATNCVLLSGASMIFLPHFDAAEVVELLPRASVMMGVPTFYSRLLGEARLTREVAAGIRLFVSGSAPLSAATHEAWAERTGHAILERYGMTETNMITSNPYDGARLPGTVGLPLPGVDVRIRDAESGAALPQGGAGRIEVRGPNVFRGYWEAAEKTAAEFTSDGWFVTGDLGAFGAEDGYLRILGRQKDLVITGGLNVYPAEVENALDALPGVAASAVIGVPHPDFGEAVVAVVVSRQSEAFDVEALRTTLRDRLAPFKLPKRIVLVEDLPRNAMGKVQKAALRETYAGLFQSGEEASRTCGRA